jgi:hypothetical protein
MTPGMPETPMPARFLLAGFLDGRPSDGGVYVHKQGTLRVLQRLRKEGVDVIVICDGQESLRTVREHGLDGVVLRRKGIRRWLSELSGTRAMKVYLGRSWGPRLSPLNRLLTRLGVDLVFFASPDRRSLQLYSHHYIFTILDLMHIEYPEFPEVSFYGEFERREVLFTEASRKAVAVIADSLSNRALIAEQYHVPLSRIFAAPFLMSRSVDGFSADEAAASKVR